METTREHIKDLYKLVGALNKLHPHRNFTPDGILVGSIGEVLAEYHYGLSPLPPGTAAHDCKLGELLVQIRTTQRTSIQIGEPCQHLLALKLLPNGKVTGLARLYSQGPVDRRVAAVPAIAYGLVGKSIRKVFI